MMADSRRPVTIRAAVVGAGLMGTRRAMQLARLPDVEVCYVCEPDRERGETLAKRVGDLQGAKCEWLWSYNHVSSTKALHLAVVAVPHDLAVMIATHLLESRINTFVEKPMGRDLDEATHLASVAEASPARLAVGFNYRHYPAVVRAKALIDQGRIGNIRLVRMVMGHGARPHYEQEWKADGHRSGGGVLLDPGIHLIDLARFLVGSLVPVTAHIGRVFWPTDNEDVAIALLHSDSGGIVSIQTSLVDWRNRFGVEIFGTDGYLKIEGRMGTYGPQTLAIGKRWAWLDGPTQAESELVERFGDHDESFDAEITQVVDAIRLNGPLPADHRDGLEAMRLVTRLYAAASASLENAEQLQSQP